MSRARFLWDDRWMPNATLTASSEETSYPVSSLVSTLRPRTWRTTGRTSESLLIDFGEKVWLNALAVIDHNFSVYATMDITCYTGSDPAVYQSTEDLWTSVYGADDFQADFQDPSGTFYTAADRAYYSANPIRIIYFDDTVQAKQVLLEFNDPENPDYYFQIGKVMAGAYLDFGIGFTDIIHGTIDPTELARSIGGQPWGLEREKYNVLRMQFNCIRYAKKYWGLKFAAERLGLTKPVLVDCFPDESLPAQRHHSIMYGKFQAMPEISTGVDNGFIDGLAVSTSEIVIEEIK